MRRLLLLISAFILYTQISWIFADNLKREQQPWEIVEVPEFSLPSLDDPSVTISRSNLAAQNIRVVNFFASWCAPCKIEHPLLMDLAAKDVKMIGIDYRDNPERAKQFLKAQGDPFHLTAVDKNGDAGADWGFSVIPQTFVIDDQNRVLFHQVGRLNPEVIERSISPLLAK